MKEFFKKFFWIFSLTNKIVPKRKKILFYSNLGFRDNVKAMYDYIVENGFDKKYKIICSCDDYKKFLVSNKNNIIFTSKYIGFLHFFTSKYVFYCFGKYPVYPSKNQKVINLWHGMPLKKIGNLENKSKVRVNQFTYVISTSQYFVNIMSQAFNCRLEQVVVLPQPRNDILFMGNFVKDRLSISNSKYILWLPTFRTSKRLNIDNGTYSNDILPCISSWDDLKKLDNQCCDLNIRIYVKNHSMDDYVPNFSELGNIKFIDDGFLFENNMNLYDLLRESSGLVTDYSSVYFDYLLLNRPIGFCINDIDIYAKKRGFVVDDPLDIMPGTYIRSFESLCHFVKDVSNEEDFLSDRRMECNNKFNFYKGFGMCRKIVEFLDM